MRRATGLRKASDCRNRAERQRGGARGLCWLDVEGGRWVVRLDTRLRVGGCVSSVVGYYKQTPAGRRMSRTDVAFGVQSGVREGLWLYVLGVPRGRACN
jgi:hypothetical protein